MDKWFYWDVDGVAFTLPFIERPIAWYGILFAVGFFLAYYVLMSLFKGYCRETTDWTGEVLKKKVRLFSERLTVYVIVSTVVGARLGHILFYERWSDYFLHPLEIVKTWEGGLASHGAVIGILLGITIFYFRSRKDFPNLSIIRILDVLVAPALLVGAMIRVGNFINQEILGTVSTLPWAVVFGHPIDGSVPVPRHPAQLYEAFYYMLSFFLFRWLYPRFSKRAGWIAGLFFVDIFTFRFLVEFVKEKQSYFLGSDFLTMGQLLSIPMVIFGTILLVKKRGEPKGSAARKAY